MIAVTKKICGLTKDIDLTNEQLIAVLTLAQTMKQTLKSRELTKREDPYARALAGKYLTLLFEKPSLRTRLTFELAIKQLGGDAVTVMGPIADREPLSDVARNLSCWTQGIIARVFEQKTIEELAKWSSVPVINALSDLYHPCQALADFLTIHEQFGGFKGIKLAFVGDGNNVAHSLMLGASRLGMDFSIATPRDYAPEPTIVAQAKKFASANGSTVVVTSQPEEAVQGVGVVYTDVWVSMGQEDEAEARKAIFEPYQVNKRLMSVAGRKAIFMHCLPAKRGLEVTDEVIESLRSVVFDQAENRLHAQKALLLMLLGEEKK